MKKPLQIRDLTTEEREALVKGMKSKSGFTLRRSHILLLNVEGKTARQIARQLHCGDQTVRNVIRAFEREGLTCLQEKSRRPLKDARVFDAEGLEQLKSIVHRSPRDFGKDTSIWTLELLADVCFEQQWVARPISYELVRRALKQVGVNWRTARHHITSNDPDYQVKKTT